MVLQVKVIPRAQRSEVIGPMADGTLKVRIAAVPEDGKANEELCRTLAAHYKIPRSSVEVITGQTNTRKMVRLPDTP